MDRPLLLLDNTYLLFTSRTISSKIVYIRLPNIHCSFVESIFLHSQNLKLALIDLSWSLVMLKTVKEYYKKVGNIRYVKTLLLEKIYVHLTYLTHLS